MARFALALGALLALAAPALAQKSFVRDDLASEAVRLEERVRREEGAQGAPAGLRRSAETFLGRGDARRALAGATAAAAADGRDAEAWRLVARAALAVEPKDGAERYALTERASASAYLAYQRSTNRDGEAASLALLGEVYERRETWRPALSAYKASLDLQDDPARRATYEELLRTHGFRITDYKVDSDAQSPRACFEFSEALAKGRTDFAPYVAVSGPRADTAITAEDRQICVEGLRHGERYSVSLRGGIPSAAFEALPKAADYEIYVRDRKPAVRFTGRNYVLPRTGQQGIPVVTVNAGKVEVEVYRIGERGLLPTVRSEEFLQQLGGSAARRLAEEQGTKIWSGSLDAREELNRDVTTAFPVQAAVGELKPGIHVMLARLPGGPADEDTEETRATQWFTVSDIGLTAFGGEDGLHLLARSLASAAAMPGVELKLLARNNEVLGTARTDARGYARFDPGLSRGVGGMAASLVQAGDGRGDNGFLDLGQTAFDLTDRGVKGRAAPGPLDALLYAERGVYRSGETVHLTALLRDAAGAAVPGLPLTLVIQRPDGVEYRRALVQDGGLGGRALSVPLLSSVGSGTWRVSAYSDPKRDPIGETRFLVEDYVPERLVIDLKPKRASMRPGEPAEIDVDARYLYGAPGAGLEVTGEVTLQAADGVPLPALQGYRVGLTDEPFEAVTNEIESRATTDASGRAVMLAPVPEVAAARPLEAKVTVRVGEPGGRAVARTVTVPVLPRGALLGVKPLFADGGLSEGSAAAFEVVLASAQGARLARPGLRWTLSRIERRYQWFNQDGRWSFEASKSTRRVADGTVEARADEPARITMPVGLGAYRLDVRAEGLAGTETSLAFNVGWEGERTADTPDALDVTLDKAAYAAGDTMQVRLNPRFAGTVTLAVVSERLHAMEVVDVPAEGTTARLAVKAEWGPGAYVVALAHRPLDQAARRMPGRAIGVAHFSVDRAKRGLQVSLGAPATMRPRGALNIPVRVAGLDPGEEAYVTVAAVDAGILNLTRYEAPSASNHYFGQRRLGAEVRDLYGHLIDGMQGTLGAIRSGGDAAAAMEGAPPTEAPLARHSGVVKLGPDGTATVSFDIPAFNGLVRVMAVAWSKGRAGEASGDVTVRDPVVMTGTLPRFLAVGDQSRFHVEIDNVEGPAGDYLLDLDLRGPVSVPAEATRRTLRLAAGGRTSVAIPVTAAGLGTATFDLRLTGPGVDATKALALRVQPSTSTIARRTVRPLEPGSSLTLSRDLLSDLLPGSGAVSVAVSPLSALDVPALLRALDRYPYGCTEQTVSRALPLLSLNRLAAGAQLALDEGADERVRGAIDRALTRQGSNGAFGLWSAGGDDLWLDAYVTDFLTRARERGFAVPQRAFDLALDRLRNIVANISEVEAKDSAGMAYALYALARNGRAVMGDLRYLTDTKLAGFAGPLAKGQLAAALALLGDRGRAERVFREAVTALAGVKDEGVSRPDYGSRLRDGAGLLALMAEAGADRADIQRASLDVEEARAAVRLTSTQEQSWMILAAAALAREGEGPSLSLDGAPQRGPLYRTLNAASLEERPLVVANTGPGAVRASVTVSGVPLAAEPAIDRGFTLERTLHSLKGERVDPARLRQNDRVVVVLKVTEREARYGRLLLVDPLPAGLEIDNPSLVDGSRMEGLDWLKREVEPVHTEYREDRFVAAFEREAGQSAIFSVAYLARAVSPGRYTHPAAGIEDMYRPDRYGRTGFGSAEIAPARP